MPDKSNKFHEFALKSILFKGHYDLYFCYLKAEKIAHVLSVLQNRSASNESVQMNALVAGASRLPETIVHFAAGEMELAVVLADLFSLLSSVRLSSTQNFIHTANAKLIESEYEALAERITGGGRLSPFVTSEDFLLPSMPEQAESMAALGPTTTPLRQTLHLKDSKGQYKGQQKQSLTSQGHAAHTEAADKRAAAIVAFVRKHAGSSIKNISRVIKDCSEKTIQRELALLIEQGLVEKRGERRWSVYYPL